MPAHFLGTTVLTMSTGGRVTLPAVSLVRASGIGTAAATALIVLLGWLLGSSWLESWVSGRTPMKANTAIAILLLALSLAAGTRRLLSSLLAAAAGAIAMLTLVEIVTGADLGLDELLFHETPGAIATPTPGQMSTMGACIVIALAVAIVLAAVRDARLVLAGQIVGVLALLLALTSAVAILANAQELLSFGRSSMLSVPAAVALLALALVTLLGRTDVGVGAGLVRRGFEGFVLRASLAAALVVPIALGVVRAGLRSAGMDSTSSEWLYTVLVIAAFGVFAWILARLLGNALSAYTATAERLRGVVEHSPLAVVTLDPQGDVVSWNPGAERMFGWRAGEVVGHPYPLAQGAELEDVRAELATVAGGEQLLLEHVRHRKDGEEVVVRVAAGPLWGPDGSFAGQSIVLADITRQRRAEAELIRLNQELERRVEERTAELSAANAELRSFSYSISHDLRTPLRALDGFSQALLEDYAPLLDEQARDYLGRIRAASQRMAALIDDILGLSRVTRAELVRRRVDVSALARELGDELRRANPGCAVRFEVDDGLTVEADPQLLRVALQNLLENAWKFTSTVPRPVVEVRAASLDGESGFAVADNGVGFPELGSDKLFRPFQRLHRASEFPGNGIGLATVMSVAKRHGGTARAESPADGGARFTVTFGGHARPLTESRTEAVA